MQAMLRRAVWLKGRNVLFSQGDPLYLDKARRHPNCSFLIGADAALRMLDPKWGVDVEPLLNEFCKLNVKFFVTPRKVDGLIRTFMDVRDVVAPLGYGGLFLPGACVKSSEYLDMSSSQLREGSK